jgi:hypothetical protein
MNRRVLLIDADRAFRANLSEQLGPYRVIVMAEPDIDRALRLATTETPALILIAIEEREKTTGFRAFQKCKKSMPEVPVALVTSTVSPEELAKHKKLKSHADAYFDKRTLAPTDLLARIDALIQLGEPEAAADDGLDVPVEDALELADGDVVLDESVGEEVSSAVAAETEAAFDALLGGDEPPAPRTVAAPSPPAIAGNASPSSERAAVPEPVPHPGRPDSAPYPAVQEATDDLESGGVPEPVPHPTSPHDELLAEEGDEPLASATVAVGEDDMVPVDDLPDEVDAARAQEPAHAPEPVLELERHAPLANRSGAHPTIEPPLHADALPAEHRSPHAIDLGLEAVERDAQTEQSGLHDRLSLRKSADLERQIAQLRQELERSRAEAETAAKGGGREAQFLKLREQLDMKDRELKQARVELASRDGDIAEHKQKIETLQHARTQLEGKNQQLEQRIFESGDRIQDIEARAQAATAQIAALERQVDAQQAELSQTARAHEAAGTEAARAHDAALAEAARARDGALQQLRDELERAHATERDAAVGELRHAAAKEHETTLADLAKKQTRELVRLKADLAGELAQLNEDLGGEIAQLKSALEAREAELVHGAATHAAALETLTAKQRTDLEALAAKHAAELESMREEHGEVRERDAEAQAHAIGQLKQQLDAATAAHEAKLREARRELEGAIAQHEEHKSQLHDRHRGELAERDRAHQEALEHAASEREQLETDAEHAADAHRSAVADQQRRHDAALADAREIAEREANELHATIAVARRAAEDTTTRAAAEREQLEQQHAHALAEQQAKHERAVAIANGDFLKQKAIADAEHTRVVKDITAEKEEVQRGLSSSRDALKQSQAELASAVQTIAERNNDLRQHAAAIAERDQRIIELRREIEALEQENTSYQDQVLRAYQKIKSDEAMVAKARKAMAIALTVLDVPTDDKAPA